MYLKFYLNVLLNLFNELWHIKYRIDFLIVLFCIAKKESKSFDFAQEATPKKITSHFWDCSLMRLLHYPQHPADEQRTSNNDSANIFSNIS